MSDFAQVVSTLFHSAAFIACLWWAYWALREMDISRRFGLAVGVRLLLVLALGTLVYSPVSRVLGGLFSLFTSYYSGWVRAVEVIGALA
ncbi:MAG: hypothetical protein WBA34_09675, partial [Candidatus Deferrimicrobiaceae bacterium]